MVENQKLTKGSLLVFILVSHFFDHVFNNILSPLFPLIQMEIPMSYTEISVLGIISSFFLFLFQAQFGGLSDRVGPKYIIAFSLIFDGLAMITTGFATTYILLLIAQLAFGVGISALHPPCFSTLQSNYPKNFQGKVMSYFGVAANVGNSVAPVLSVTLALLLGSWRYGLWVISGIGIFWGLILLIAFPTAQVNRSERSKEKVSIREKVPPISIIALILFINTARGAVYRSVTQFTSLVFTDLFFFTPLEASGIFTLVSVVGAAFSLLGGVIADRTSRRFPIILGQIAGVICITTTALTTDPMIAVIGFLGTGAAIFIGFGGIQAFQSDVTPKGNVGFSWGLIMGLNVLTRSLMLIPFGMIGDIFNLRSSLLFLAVVLGVGTIPAFWVKEETEETNTIHLPNSKS